MLWQKIIDFDEAPENFYASGFYTQLQQNDADRAVANRLDQTSSQGILVENESGLKTFLEKIIINNEENLYCTRIALEGLSSFNELFGHAGADDILRRTIAHIFKGIPGAEDVHIFRTGADWSLIFTGKNAASLQATALSWLDNPKNTLTVEKGKRCIVATLSFQAEINNKTLRSAFTVINALRPGRSTVGESLQSMDGLVCHGVTDVLHTIEVPLLDLTNMVKDYIGPQKDYTPQFISREQAESIDRAMQTGADYNVFAEERLVTIQNRLEEYMKLPKGNISIMNSEEYQSKYRLEGSYVFMENDKTMIIPITNAFGEVVFAIKIILVNPVEDWNNPALLIKNQNNRLSLTYRVNPDNAVLSEFRKAPINEALDELMYLRKYDPLFGLLEPSGRTMYFGRMVEPYVNYLRGLSSSEIENIVQDTTKPIELRAVAKIILRDGFVLLRCGGEEFVVVARDKENNWFTMSYDYNKFSRFGTTFGEAASDMYMQSSAGIMQYELKNIITAHYTKGLTFSTYWLADTLQDALRRMTNREIKYECSADFLEKELRTKSGKKIYAVNEKGEWYLFAADTEKELHLAIINSKLGEDANAVTELMRGALELKPLKIYTVLSVINNIAEVMTRKDDRVIIDLNKVLGVNPKAVFTQDPLNEDSLEIHPGNLLQGVLRGLSLSGGVMAWDVGLTLDKAIMVSDTIAEHAKEIVNQQLIIGNEQTTIIDSSGQMRLLDKDTAAVYFGIKPLFN